MKIFRMENVRASQDLSETRMITVFVHLMKYFKPEDALVNVDFIEMFYQVQQL